MTAFGFTDPTLFLSLLSAPVEPSLAIQVFFAGLRSAASGDLERTRRRLELAARLYGEQNGARIVHALLTLSARPVKFFRTAGMTWLLAKTDLNSHRGTTR